MVMVRLNPSVDGPLAAALVDLWTRVVNHGGTVGFVGPVTQDDVRPVAQRAFSRTAARMQDLAVAWEGDRVVGMGFLDHGEPPLTSHLGTIRRLMRDPQFSGAGIGAVILAALEKAAAQRGIGRVTVEVRGGRGKEAWYASRGYAVDATLPDRVRANGVPTEVVHMSKSLDGVGTGTGGRPDIRLAIQQLDPDLPLPRYAHPGDAGLDLYSSRDLTLQPGERDVVQTGVAVAIPEGYVGLVHPRSGLAARSGVSMVNAPGTIDAGYRGEVKVILINHDLHKPVDISRGDRIAQLVIQQVEVVQVEHVAELPRSARGTGGFGSTGR